MHCCSAPCWEKATQHIRALCPGLQGCNTRQCHAALGRALQSGSCRRIFLWQNLAQLPSVHCDSGVSSLQSARTGSAFSSGSQAASVLGHHIFPHPSKIKLKQHLDCTGWFLQGLLPDAFHDSASPDAKPVGAACRMQGSPKHPLRKNPPGLGIPS